MFNGRDLKAQKTKAQIVIILNDYGQVGVQVTSKNLVTNLGMMALATELVKKLSEPSNIVQP